MRIRIIKHCSIDIDGNIHRAKLGEIITLDDHKATKIINSGYAESAMPTINEARAMASEFSKLDPGGDCWTWIKDHHPALWREHINQLLVGDISAARLSFNSMIQAWGSRPEQPALPV